MLRQVWRAGWEFGPRHRVQQVLVAGLLAAILVVPGAVTLAMLLSGNA
ncbi:MAG: hypothetical protein ACKVVT_00870 [Dehalococcoidia bacterium]